MLLLYAEVKGFFELALSILKIKFTSQGIFLGKYR